MDDHGRSPSNQPILYVLDTNVLIHDPNALLNFEEHHVAIPMTVLEELDKLKSGHHSVAAECRQAIRLIDPDPNNPVDIPRFVFDTGDLEATGIDFDMRWKVTDAFTLDAQA